MQKSKDLTFIGFSIKAKKVIYGLNLIKESRLKFYLLILCHSASDNTKKIAINIANKNKIRLLITHEILLEEIVNKTNSKVIALTDKNLAEAVLQNMSNALKAFDGGNII